MLHNVRGKHSLYSQSKRQRREKQTHTPSLGCTAQNTAQHSFPPPKNTLSNSQHCSLSCAAAPEELSVRNCKIAQGSERAKAHSILHSQGQ